MAIFINILLVLNLIIGLLLITVALMQRPKQEGLGAAFGGGMTDNIFGAQTTNVLAKGTRWLGAIFLALSLTISALYARQINAESPIQKELLSSPQPAEAAVSPEATSEADAATTSTPEAAASPEATAPVATPEATPSPEATPEATVAPEAEAAPAEPASPEAETTP